VRQRVQQARAKSQQQHPQQHPQQQQEQQQQQGLPAGPSTSSNSSHVAQVKRHLETVLAGAAGAATASAIQHLGIGAMCSTRPFPYSGERIVAVHLAANCPSPQEVASKMAQQMRGDAAFVWNVAPSAVGRCLQLVGCEQMANSTVASQVGPVSVRHGFAASDRDVVSKATAADKPLCTTVVFLAADDPVLLDLCDRDAAPDSMQVDGVQDSLDADQQASQQHCADVLLKVQRSVKAWLEIQQTAAAAGISSNDHLASMLLLADTFAGVASQLTLLPLADASGMPHLALFASHLSSAACPT